MSRSPGADAGTPGPASSAAGSPAAPSQGGGGSSIRIPAAFSVSPGRARPATVSFPAHLAVDLELRSADGRPHRAALGAPGAVALSVPTHGQGVERIPGLAPGHYVLRVDGVPSGALEVGGEPGP